jgi:hypothetical protein
LFWLFFGKKIPKKNPWFERFKMQQWATSITTPTKFWMRLDFHAYII